MSFEWDFFDKELELKLKRNLGSIVDKVIALETIVGLVNLLI